MLATGDAPRSRRWRLGPRTGEVSAELCETRMWSAPSFPTQLGTLGSVWESRGRGPGKERDLEDVKPGGWRKVE